ncbi:MAG TPA: inositol monophosphatase family protein [Xanthomonadales bacterium]|nr:inositol monophosphatase family protein [Xanthomonadales bacterium]
MQDSIQDTHPEMLAKTLSDALRVALQAAEQSAELIRHYYLGNFAVEIKADQTPVTVADRESEAIIRKVVLDAFPQHGFFGEETGTSQGDADYLWLVDPIDGTKSFVAGYGMFSTQIALMHRGKLVLGVSSAPAHQEMAWAVRGGKVVVNGKPARLRPCSELSKAAISTGNIQSLAKSRQWQALGDILAQANRTRGYGDYYHYHRLAAGQIDAVIESDVNILDIAALAVIVEAAGGVFTDLQGKAPDLQTRSVLAAGPELHAQLLARLNNTDGL